MQSVFFTFDIGRYKSAQHDSKTFFSFLKRFPMLTAAQEVVTYLVTYLLISS